jgi:hypothetical protein
VLASAVAAQNTGNPTTPSTTPQAQPAPGTTPVGGDTQAAKSDKSSGSAQGQTPAQSQPGNSSPGAQPAPGTAPVGGDTPPTTNLPLQERPRSGAIQPRPTSSRRRRLSPAASLSK